MADEDLTDSPAARIKATEDPRSLHGPETGESEQTSVAGKTPDALSGVLNDEDLHKSNTVKLQQKEMLDELKCKKSQTSGGIAPKVDEEMCEKKALKISGIDPNVFIEACNLLNIHKVLGNDWRALAGKLGYPVINVKIFGGQSNPAESMLCDWDGANDRNNLEKLLEALQKMNRQDVIQLFQKEIDKKGESCNCPDCGHLM